MIGDNRLLAKNKDKNKVSQKNDLLGPSEQLERRVIGAQFGSKLGKLISHDLFKTFF